MSFLNRIPKMASKLVFIIFCRRVCCFHLKEKIQVRVFKLLRCRVKYSVHHEDFSLEDMGRILVLCLIRGQRLSIWSIHIQQTERKQQPRFICQTETNDRRRKDRQDRWMQTAVVTECPKMWKRRPLSQRCVWLLFVLRVCEFMPVCVRWSVHLQHQSASSSSAEVYLGSAREGSHVCTGGVNPRPLTSAQTKP